MSLEQFHQDLLLDVKSSAVAQGNYERVQFTEVALAKLADADEAIDVTPAQFEGAGRNKKKLQIDAYGFDPVDDSIICVVTDYSPTNEIATITKTEVDSLLGDLKAFIEMALDDEQITNLEHSSQAAEAAFEIRSKIHSAARIRAFLVSNRVLSDRVKTINDSTLGLKRLEFAVWDLQRLYNSFTSSQGREEIEIDLTQWLPEGLPALKARSNFENVSTFLAVMPGRALAEIYDRFGSRLLEGNVRSFLSARGSVNKGIRATILASPEQFLAFNNGLSTTATGVETKVDSEGLKILKIRDLQIVNGGQTTASLFTYMRQEKEKLNHLDEVSVQLKLIVVPPEAAAELVPKIARFANTQNRISETDFFSNSPFHVRMEEWSQKLNAGPKSGEVAPTRWFYERTRGAYLNEKTKLNSAADEKKFERQYPRNQVITKMDLAKYHNSWNQKPHIVSRGAQKNFVDFASDVADKYATEEGKQRYGDDYYKRIVAQAIIFERARKIISSADWYQTGYLANLVTYAIAKVSREISKHNLDLPWAQIWRTQVISTALEANLLNAALVALKVFNDPTRVQQNVGEWTKTEACWKKVSDHPLDLTQDFLESLESSTLEEKRERVTEEKAKGKLLGELEKLKMLLSVTSSTWDEITSSNRLSVSPMELSIVKTLRRDGYVSEKQADKLLALIVRARNEGMSIPE